MVQIEKKKKRKEKLAPDQEIRVIWQADHTEGLSDCILDLSTTCPEEWRQKVGKKPQTDVFEGHFH